MQGMTPEERAQALVDDWRHSILLVADTSEGRLVTAILEKDVANTIQAAIREARAPSPKRQKKRDNGCMRITKLTSAASIKREMESMEPGSWAKLQAKLREDPEATYKVTLTPTSARSTTDNWRWIMMISLQRLINRV